MDNIVLIGIMGCGKSTIGKILAHQLDYDFIDCDEYLENKYEKKISDCFAISEQYFRDLETEVAEELSKQSRKVISTGGGIVTRKKNLEYFKNDKIFFINRPIDNILIDINTNDRPLIKNNKDMLKKIYDSRIDLYREYSHYEILNDNDLVTAIDKIKNLSK